MIYGHVKLQQISPAEELAVSWRDKRRPIGCFSPDRQGDNPASVCVNKNAAISPSPTTGLTPLSISRAPIITNCPSPPPLPSPVCSSRFERREVVLPGAGGGCQCGDEVPHGDVGCQSFISSSHSNSCQKRNKKKKQKTDKVNSPVCARCKHSRLQSQKAPRETKRSVWGRCGSVD